MKRTYYACDGCEAEIPDKKPIKCPLCGRKNFQEIEREIKESPEDDKYKKIYDKVLEQLEKYNEDTEPEDTKFSFAD